MLLECVFFIMYIIYIHYTLYVKSVYFMSHLGLYVILGLCAIFRM
jgi:hypothetical protein